MRAAGLVAFLTAGPLAAASAQVLTSDTTRFERLYRFEVNDTTRLRSMRLGAGLTLEVRRELDAAGAVMGWAVSVRRPGRELNYLYHSIYLHGAYPTDLFAWHHQRGEFGDDRILPVYGYPYDLRLRCLGCETEGDSAAVHFTRGTVEVGMRRLAKANPPTFAGRR